MPPVRSCRILRFDAFSLDLGRCALRRGNDEFLLRPKSFDVLRYLAEHPNRVVSKDELFQAVWPTVSVTDDSLVQCIKEVRQALGDGSRQLLKTVSKRGYLLDAEVAEIEVLDHASGKDQAAPAEAAREPAGPPGRLLQAAIRKLRLRPMSAIAAAILLVTALAGGLALLRHAAPTATAAHYAILGTALLDKERSQQSSREALTLFDKALVLDPDHVLALVGYARVIVTDVVEGWVTPHERSMRLIQAETVLDRALKVAPNDSQVHHISGLMWRARGEPERAVAELERALQLSPTRAGPRAALGRAKLEAGDSEGAISDLEIAMRLAPDEPTIYIWYFQAGLAAVYLGDGEAALKWFAKSAEASPAYRRHILLYKAVALADLGREDEAKALVAQYLADSPEMSVANWSSHFRTRNTTVAAQRTRIVDTLRRLGMPAGEVKTGSVAN